jgi:glutamate transport system substrate-binding protein
MKQGTTGRTFGLPKTISVVLLVVALLGTSWLLWNRTGPPHPTPHDNKTHDDAPLNIGVQITDSPGFNSMTDGQRSGFDIDVANYIANGLGRHANFVPITVGSRDEQLKKGYVDMVVATYSITDAHIANGIIFAGPYIRTDQGIMTTADNTSITTTADLKDQTVCVTSGSTSALKLEALKQTMPFVITYRDTLAQCIDDMKNPTNNVAAVTSDSVILQGHAKADKQLRYVSGITIPGAYEKYGIGIDKKNEDLCKKTTKFLKDFVSTQWNSAYTANLQLDQAGAASLKPDINSIDSESCNTN